MPPAATGWGLLPSVESARAAPLYQGALMGLPLSIWMRISSFTSSGVRLGVCRRK